MTENTQVRLTAGLNNQTMTVFVDNEAQTKSPSHGFQQLFSEQETVSFLVWGGTQQETLANTIRGREHVPIQTHLPASNQPFHACIQQKRCVCSPPGCSDAATPRWPYWEPPSLTFPTSSPSQCSSLFYLAVDMLSSLHPVLPSHWDLLPLGLQVAFSEVDLVALFCCLSTQSCLVKGPLCKIWLDL